jgi:hypothetical protein
VSGLTLSEQGNGAAELDPPTSTFVVRFWREWSAAGPRWRGQIDHVQSGESARFLDLEGLLAVLERYGVIPPGTGRSIST